MWRIHSQAYGLGAGIVHCVSYGPGVRDGVLVRVLYLRSSAGLLSHFTDRNFPYLTARFFVFTDVLADERRLESRFSGPLFRGFFIADVSRASAALQINAMLLRLITPYIVQQPMCWVAFFFFFFDKALLQCATCTVFVITSCAQFIVFRSTVVRHSGTCCLPIFRQTKTWEIENGW